jgi:hypothetical protein
MKRWILAFLTGADLKSSIRWPLPAQRRDRIGGDSNLICLRIGS